MTGSARGLPLAPFANLNLVFFRHPDELFEIYVVFKLAPMSFAPAPRYSPLWFAHSHDVQHRSAAGFHCGFAATEGSARLMDVLDIVPQHGNPGMLSFFIH